MGAVHGVRRVEVRAVAAMLEGRDDVADGEIKERKKEVRYGGRGAQISKSCIWPSFAVLLRGNL